MKVLRKQRRDASPNVKAETSDHRTPSACSPRGPFSIVVSLALFFFSFSYRRLSREGSKLFRVVRRVFAPFSPYDGISWAARMSSVAGKQLATFITVRVLVTTSNYSPVTGDI